MKSASTDTASTGATSEAHHPIHHLLAALSFDHLPFQHHRETKTSMTTLSTAGSATSVRRSSRPRPVHVQHILHGTLDPDGHVEDVFFDAQEFGDQSMDSFHVTPAHEPSVVVPNLHATRGGSVEAFLDDLHVDDDDDHDDGDIPPPPAPPSELPLRFLRAGKNDPEVGMERYKATLAWRKELGMDTILRQPHKQFDFIKSNYPHYYHLRGHNGEPIFYEQPPKTDLKALRKGGVTLERLLRHYAMITEFGWQFIERDDLARSITIIDLDGIHFGDFVGEVVDYVRKASAFTGQHYPERCGTVFVINVPGWFKVIWSVVKPMVDEVTLEKIFILRGEQEIRDSMLKKIPIENIPPEYGGKSVPLGESPEEELLADLMRHNNDKQRGIECGGVGKCRFCSWNMARSY